MGRDLAESFACARAVFDEVDDRLGFGLSRLCFEGRHDVGASPRRDARFADFIGGATAATMHRCAARKAKLRAPDYLERK